jgi:hypothetical protein
LKIFLFKKEKRKKKKKKEKRKKKKEKRKKKKEKRNIMFEPNLNKQIYH